MQKVPKRTSLICVRSRKNTKKTYEKKSCTRPYVLVRLWEVQIEKHNRPELLSTLKFCCDNILLNIFIINKANRINRKAVTLFPNSNGFSLYFPFILHQLC